MKIAPLTAAALCFCMQAGAHASDGFYVNPDSNAAQWVKNHPDDPAAGKIRSAIADMPSALWLTGPGPVGARIARYVWAAANQQQIPVLVAYNLPHRDCSGAASAGGAVDGAAYRTWIDQFIQGVADRPAIVILEPDALADMQCLEPAYRSERLALLNYAVSGFKQRASHTDVYLDAGNPGWKPAQVMADALNAAGVKDARGFALNVSNFYSLAQARTYADAINAKLSSDHAYTKDVIVDTSRNGNGANPGDWCNPPGRKTGIAPQRLAPDLLALWVKLPGNSDGAGSPKTDCHGGPPAGTFSAPLAVRLIDGA